MNNVTHTPGPWIVGQPYNWHGHGFLPVGQPGPGGALAIQLAAVYPRDDARSRVNWTDADKANARLIAAAPTMALVLTEVEAVMTIVEPRSDKHEYVACLEHVRRVLRDAGVTE